MIRLRQVRKTIAGVAVLRGVDLDLDRGAALVLAGTNGSGRSTLLGILATLVRPSSGQVTIDGVDAVADPLRARRVLGFLGAGSELPVRLTPREQLFFVAASRGLAAGDRARAVDESLASVDAAPDRPIAELSPGLRRQVALAGALLGDPPLLLLDDPMSGLDPLARRRFARLLDERLRRGTSLVLSGDRFDLPPALGERVAFLHRGRLLADRRLGPGEDPVEVLAWLVQVDGSVGAAADAGPGENAWSPRS